VIVEVSPGLNSAVDIPGNRVLNPGFDANHANRANPNLASLGILPVGLLNLELNTSLNLGVRERCL
jgi:hypothetical protein